MTVRIKAKLQIEARTKIAKPAPQAVACRIQVPVAPNAAGLRTTLLTDGVNAWQTRSALATVVRTLPGIPQSTEPAMQAALAVRKLIPPQLAA
jgi:hypothetical protein